MGIVSVACHGIDVGHFLEACRRGLSDHAHLMSGQELVQGTARTQKYSCTPQMSEPLGHLIVQRRLITDVLAYRDNCTLKLSRTRIFKYLELLQNSAKPCSTRDTGAHAVR